MTDSQNWQVTVLAAINVTLSSTLLESLKVNALLKGTEWLNSFETESIRQVKGMCTEGIAMEREVHAMNAAVALLQSVFAEARSDRSVDKHGG